MKKKRTYRTVKVKQVDRVRLAEVWRGARLVVGLDVGKEEMVVSLMDQERVVRQSVKWKHLQENRRCKLRHFEHALDGTVFPGGDLFEGRARVEVREEPRETRAQCVIWHGVIKTVRR